jgi:hypothetical protein
MTGGGGGMGGKNDHYFFRYFEILIRLTCRPLSTILAVSSIYIGSIKTFFFFFSHPSPHRISLAAAGELGQAVTLGVVSMWIRHRGESDNMRAIPPSEIVMYPGN